MDEPRNQASEWYRWALESLTGVEQGDVLDLVRSSLTEGFVYEDRKRLVGSTGGVEAFGEAFRAYYSVAEDSPRFIVDEVVAVRGEALAVVQARVSYASAWDSEFVVVIALNRETGLLDRAIAFDPEDRTAALEELDRLHVHLGGSDSGG